MMSKYKVGDKVRVLRDGDECEYWCEYEKGDIHEITYVYNSGDYEVGWQTMHPDDIEPVTTTNTLTIGQTYTSVNGNKWECIYTRGDKAWLVGVFDGKPEGSAYAFDIDGTASWASNADEYRIVFEPVRETVKQYVKYAYGEFFNYDGCDDSTKLSITFDTLDGTPDWSTAKVTPV